MEQLNGGQGTRTIEVFPKTDSMLVGQTYYYDVIKVKQHYQEYYYHVNGGPSWTSNYYYSKNVGLIKHEQFAYGGLVHQNDLVNYYIAPH